MKAVFIDRYGGPEVLKYGEFPTPTAGPLQVLVKVAAASINPVDAMERSGQTKAWNPIQFPGVLGWDLSGTVEAIGKEVRSLKVGDRVFGWAYHTYADFCVVDADLLAKLPDGLDLVDSAALPLSTVTGTQLISVATKVQAGQTVLVAGAVGAVGRAAVFTAKNLGAFVIAGVQAKRLAEAGTLGADQVLALDDAEALRTLPSVDIVANTVRGSTAEHLIGKVKERGTFASATGAPSSAKDYPTVEVSAFVSKKSVASMLYIAEAVKSGKVTIPIGRRLSMKDAAEGHALMEKGGIGKILLIP